MSRLIALAIAGMCLLYGGLGLILVAAVAFVLGGGKNLPGLLPYVGIALVFGGAGAALLVASLRLPVARA